VDSIASLENCSDICNLVIGCEYVSWNENKSRCYLKRNVEDREIGRQRYRDFISWSKATGETTDYLNYSNGFNLIGDNVSGIPNVKSLEKCKKICDLAGSIRSCRKTDQKACRHYTLHNGKCFLSDSMKALRYTKGAVSGSRNCI